MSESLLIWIIGWMLTSAFTLSAGEDYKKPGYGIPFVIFLCLVFFIFWPAVIGCELAEIRKEFKPKE